MNWDLLLAIGGGIVLAGNVGALIFKIIRPAINMGKRIDMLQAEVDELKEHDEKDFKTLQDMQAMSKMQCKAMLGIINHMIDGNGIAEMKETREDIQKMLTA